MANNVDYTNMKKYININCWLLTMCSAPCSSS